MGGDLIASNLSLLASGDHDERRTSALAVDEAHAVAVVDQQVTLLDLSRGCLLDRAELGSAAMEVELTSGRSPAR